MLLNHASTLTDFPTKWKTAWEILKLHSGKLEPYLLWLTALNLQSLLRALSSPPSLCNWGQLAMYRDLARIVAALKNTHRQQCYPIERKNCRMVMPYKTLLTFINTTVTRRNELLSPADSVFYLFSETLTKNSFGNGNPPVLADLFILWQKKTFLRRPNS